MHCSPSRHEIDIQKCEGNTYKTFIIQVLMAVESEHKWILRKNVICFSFFSTKAISPIIYRHQNAAKSLNTNTVNDKFENVGRWRSLSLNDSYRSKLHKNDNIKNSGLNLISIYSIFVSLHITHILYEYAVCLVTLRG